MHKRHANSLVDWPNELEARQMLVAITRGDRSALTRLYIGYYGCLAHFLSQFMASDDRIPDVINDAFTTIWETARGISFESKLSVWFFRIAHRHALKFVRCHAPRGLAGCEREYDAQTREPETETKTRRPLSWPLQRLPAEQRVVLMLCYRMAFSVREIAFITDSQDETVRLRMSQAREQLRRFPVALDEEQSI